MVPKKSLIGVLTGPTASGKSSIAIELASRDKTIELINADSLLVYRGMNIGTAKPTPSELSAVPHHLIDIRNPDETFTAGDFVRAAEEAIKDITQRGKRPLFVGGTGFYLKALIFGLWEAPPANPAIREALQQQKDEVLFDRLEKADPTSAQRIGRSDRYRLVRALEILELTGRSPTALEEEQPRSPLPHFRLWIVDRQNKELEERILKRTQSMLDAGLIEEVDQLQKQFPESRALKAIGYKQVIDFLVGRVPPGRKIKPEKEGLLSEIQLATRQLVKQQRTWFRGQSSRMEYSKWFFLEGERDKLEEEFKSVYD